MSAAMCLLAAAGVGLWAGLVVNIVSKMRVRIEIEMDEES